MDLSLHFQSTGAVPGAAVPSVMQGGSLTIGRGAENDLVLPDPDRTISKRHCAIEDSDGVPILIDLSTNGTFVNHSKVPVGDRKMELHDGDVLSIGSYVLMVDLAVPGTMADLSPEPPVVPPPYDPPEDLASSGGGKGDFLDYLLGEPPPGDVPTIPEGAEEELLGPVGASAGQGASAPSHSPAVMDQVKIQGARRPIPENRGDHLSAQVANLDPSGAHSDQQIPDDWDDLLAGACPQDDNVTGEQDRPTSERQVEMPEAPTVAEEAAEPLGSEPRAKPRVPAEVDATARSEAAVALAASDTAVWAFLQALGDGRLNIDPDDLDTVMARLGGIMREMIVGLRSILMTRSDIKGEFRIAQTVIKSRGNNPLKFSVCEDQAVEAMTVGKVSGYLEPSAAVQEAFDDIRAHEVAMITGMQAALKGLFTQLDPELITGEIEQDGGLATLFGGRKSRHWEAYKKMYAKIAEQAENEFQEMFRTEFARAYEAQMRKLRSSQ